MKRLLRLDCSSRITGSHSRELADYFEKKWAIANPDGVVIRRDLAKEQLPHINDCTIKGFYTPDQYKTPELIEATALSDRLIAELKSVDEVLISSPLYNLNVPSNLKAYLDQIVRIGHTFNINESGHYSLLEKKIAHLITTKGGVYKGTAMEKFDFQQSYLKTILGQLGIEIQNNISLEGSTGESKALAERKLSIKNLISSKFDSVV